MTTFRPATARVHLQAVQLLAPDEPQPVHARVLDRPRPVVVLHQRPASLDAPELLPLPVLAAHVVPVAGEEPLLVVLEASATLL